MLFFFFFFCNYLLHYFNYTHVINLLTVEWIAKNVLWSNQKANTCCNSVLDHNCWLKPQILMWYPWNKWLSDHVQKSHSFLTSCSVLQIYRQHLCPESPSSTRCGEKSSAQCSSGEGFHIHHKGLTFFFSHLIINNNSDEAVACWNERHFSSDTFSLLCSFFRNVAFLWGSYDLIILLADWWSSARQQQSNSSGVTRVRFQGEIYCNKEHV